MAETERNIAVKISFLGTAYHGFQRQKNSFTIQQLIEETLEKIIGEKPVIYGCSRTDSYVSAREYVFNFKTKNGISAQKLKGALNHFLPSDVAALDVCEAQPDFHARYMTQKKTYKYYIRNSKQKDPFSEGRVCLYGQSILDEEFLNAQAQDFLGKHDFSAFCSSGCSAKSHIREIYDARVERAGDDVIFTFTADGFLYNQVRIMVGTLLFISEGKIKKGEIPKIIESKNRKKAGKTVLPCGLYLDRVFYENNPFENREKGE